MHTTAGSQDAAQAWCLRVAETSLVQLGAPVLSAAWVPGYPPDSQWRAESCGTPVLMLQADLAGQAWRGLVQRPDTGEVIERPDVPRDRMQDAMAWCESTAAAWRTRLQAAAGQAGAGAGGGDPSCS